MENASHASFERLPIGSASSVHLRADQSPLEAITPKSIMAAMAQFASLASILRLSGALTVVAAMSAFLLQGWTSGNDINRYYLLLAQTMLLAGGGFCLSYLLNENKGARVFFGLSLLSGTANMVTLGALIFSITQWGGNLSHYPAFASWKAPTIGAAGMAIGIGMLVLSPVTIFGFMVLARRSAVPLAGLFLFTNLLPLAPARESVLVGVLAMLGVLVPLAFIGKLMKHDPTLRTVEGYFAIAALFAPALIIVTRSLCFYHMDALLQLLLAATGFVLLRIVSPKPHLGVGLTSFALAGCIARPLAHIIGSGSDYLFYTVFGLAFAGLGLDITARSNRNKRLFALLAGGMPALTQLLLLCSIDDTLSTLLFIAAGIVVLWIGRMFRQRHLVLFGAGMAVFGIVFQLYHIVALVNFFNWATLAALGVTAIIAASIIESHGAVIKLKYRQAMAFATNADE